MTSSIATINYVRKRPTDELQIGTRVSINDWNGVRADGDVSGAFTDNARGRLVVAKEDSESYLDRHLDQTDLTYGIVEIDLGEQSLLTLGHSYNKSASEGVMWGALPLLYADGTPTDYDASTSNAPDWTFADSTQKQTFVEFEQQLAERWTFNAIYTRNTGDFTSELFYVYGAPNRADETSFTDPVGGFPVLGGEWVQGNTPPPNFVAHNPAMADATGPARYQLRRLSRPGSTSSCGPWVPPRVTTPKSA